MKHLRFSPDLVGLILSESKASTWLLFDDKDLKTGDEVLFLDSSNDEPFAQALLTEVKTTSFGNLEPIDWDGHERYKNDSDMYRTYSDYYGQTVGSSTALKVVHFKIIK